MKSTNHDLHVGADDSETEKVNNFVLITLSLQTNQICGQKISSDAYIF